MRATCVISAFVFVAALLGGCVTPERADPFAGLQMNHPATFKNLSVVVVPTENTKKATDYLSGKGLVGPCIGCSEQSKAIFANIVGVFLRNFGTVSKAENMQEAKASRPDLIAVVDVYASLLQGISATNKLDVGSIFLTIEERSLDTISASHEVSGWSYMSHPAALEDLSKVTAQRFEGKLLASMKIREFAQARGGATVAGVPSASTVIPAAVIHSDVDELPARKSVQKKNAYAVVMGIELYRQGLPQANFARQDAQITASYLTKVLGFPEENVILLTNDRALKSDLEKYLEKWLYNNVEPGSSVFVYYSGHGAPNPRTGDAYLVPYDGDPAFIDETGYSLKRMYAALGQLSAKEVVVALDSCFSGAGGRSVIAKGSRPLVMNLQTAAALPQNMTVLSASAGDQTSSTYDEKGHGLFTYFMLKAIKEADVVRQDGSLKVKDIYSYMKPQVESIARKKYNNEQTPQLIEGKK